MPDTTERRRSLPRRLAWFAAFWLLGLGAVTLVAVVIRLVIPG